MQKKQLPRLDIVSVRNLILHEDVENYRVQRIMKLLKDDGSLKSPPIVGVNKDHRRFLVLDGASRVTAARRLGYPHLLVQLVPYPSPEIKLDRWHHLVVGMNLATLVEKAGHISGVILEPSPWGAANRALEEQKILACFHSPRKRPMVMRPAHPGKDGLQPVRELTRLYATDPGLHRVREDQVAFPDEWLGEDRVLVLFPRYRQEDIVRFGLRMKDRLPMGITRHTVPNRALRLHYPVSELRSSASLREKRIRLRAYLEEKWEQGKIRYYPEPTTLYDE